MMSYWRHASLIIFLLLIVGPGGSCKIALADNHKVILFKDISADSNDASAYANNPQLLRTIAKNLYQDLQEIPNLDFIPPKILCDTPAFADNKSCSAYSVANSEDPQANWRFTANIMQISTTSPTVRLMVTLTESKTKENSASPLSSELTSLADINANDEARDGAQLANRFFDLIHALLRESGAGPDLDYRHIVTVRKPLKTARWPLLGIALLTPILAGASYAAEAVPRCPAFDGSTVNNCVATMTYREPWAITQGVIGGLALVSFIGIEIYLGKSY
jgi:hypothetical protein